MDLGFRPPMSVRFLWTVGNKEEEETRVKDRPWSSSILFNAAEYRGLTAQNIFSAVYSRYNTRAPC